MSSSARNGAISVHRYPLGIWIGIVFSLALCASALYWDSSRVVLGPDSSWATIAQLNEEYRAATRELILPGGHDWPATPPYTGTAPDGAKNSYAAGIGTEWAEWYWFDMCAAVAVSSTVSASARQTAIDQLPGFYETRAFSTAADPDYYRDTITAAQSGDLAALREYVDSVESSTGNGE
jgi:hypothetical protein